MKKFMYLYYGFTTPTEEIGKAWGDWFAKVGEHMVDGGNPFIAGREITADGTKDLPMDMEAITGYSIINAENLDAAEKIAQTNPMIAGIRVYEVGSM